MGYIILCANKSYLPYEFYAYGIKGNAHIYSRTIYFMVRDFLCQRYLSFRTV